MDAEDIVRARLAIRDNQTHLTLVGRARRFVYRLLGYEGELCDFCGGRYGLVWSADRELWCAVMPYDLGLACPECFSARAVEQGFRLLWEPRIERVRERGEWLTPHPHALARHFGQMQ